MTGTPFVIDGEFFDPPEGEPLRVETGTGFHLSSRLMDNRPRQIAALVAQALDASAVIRDRPWPIALLRQARRLAAILAYGPACAALQHRTSLIDLYVLTIARKM